MGRDDPWCSLQVLANLSTIRMNMKSLIKILLISLLCIGSGLLNADQLIMKTGKKETVSITEISKTDVIADGKKVPLTNIKEIVFSASELPAKKSGVILKDGTVLSGIIRKSDKKEFVFRSTTFGTLTIPQSDVAVLYYFGVENALRNLGKVKNYPVIIEASGTEYAGKILWCDAKSAGILTAAGLKKIPAENMALLAYEKFNDKDKIVLRNGDRLQQPKEMNGSSLKFSFGELSIKAIKSFKLN